MAAGLAIPVILDAKESVEIGGLMAYGASVPDGYRWVGIYKISRGDFVIVARTGETPPAYPRFPITQGLAGSAVESKQSVMVADVHKDPRYLPTFGSTMSEIVVPIIAESGRAVGLIDVESEKLNAFTEKDREFLERAAALLARALK